MTDLCRTCGQPLFGDVDRGGALIQIPTTRYDIEAAMEAEEETP